MKRPPTLIEQGSSSGWIQPDSSQTRPWYFYAFVVAITVIGAGMAALVALVIFFGLGAGI